VVETTRTDTAPSSYPAVSDDQRRTSLSLAAGGSRWPRRGYSRTAAAGQESREKFSRKPLKELMDIPRVIVIDQLGSYEAA
jgi:hypothetical protein